MVIKSNVKNRLVGFIVGILLMITIFIVMELTKTFDNILDYSWLEKQLGLESYEIVEVDDIHSNAVVNILTQLYPEVTFNQIYLHKDRKVKALHFQINEFYFGLATIDYNSNNKIKQINFYNQFDLSLKEYFNSTHIVKIFYGVNNQDIIYDEFNEHLYVCTNERLIDMD